MTIQEAVDFIQESEADLFYYGYDGVMVEKYDAINDILLMNEDEWNNGDVTEVEKRFFVASWEGSNLTATIEAYTVEEVYGMCGRFYFDQGGFWPMPCPTSVEEK